METLSVLLGLLTLSVFILVPGQGRQTLGLEMLVLGAVIAAVLLIKGFRLPRAAVIR